MHNFSAYSFLNRCNLYPKRFLFKYACLLIQRRTKGITFAFIQFAQACDPEVGFFVGGVF